MVFSPRLSLLVFNIFLGPFGYKDVISQVIYIKEDILDV